MTSFHQQKKSGFTLLEVIIALTLFAFVSISVYEVTSRSFQLRESLESEGDYFNRTRAALDLIARDITSFYSPQLTALPPQLAQEQLPNAGDTSFQILPATPYWSSTWNKFGMRLTRLRGDEDKLSFISSNHFRIYKDSKESQFIKVAYSYENETSELKSEKALVRRIDPNIYADTSHTSETEQRFVILKKIKNFQFEYLDPQADQWIKHWDNEDPQFRNSYPGLIRITVIIEPDSPRLPELRLTQVMRPEAEPL